VTPTPTPPTTPPATPPAAIRSLTVARIGLIVLAVQGLGLGLWSTISPRGFYDDFPALGTSWISPDGPYNEHLVRDYGALNLALGVLALCAAIWLTRALVASAAIAWIVYSIPHIAYHVLNGESYDTSDHVAIVASLAFTPIVAIVVLVASARAESPAT